MIQRWKTNNKDEVLGPEFPGHRTGCCATSKPKGSCLSRSNSKGWNTLLVSYLSVRLFKPHMTRRRQAGHVHPRQRPMLITTDPRRITLRFAIPRHGLSVCVELLIKSMTQRHTVNAVRKSNYARNSVSIFSSLFNRTRYLFGRETTPCAA